MDLERWKSEVGHYLCGLPCWPIRQRPGLRQTHFGGTELARPSQPRRLRTGGFDPVPNQRLVTATSCRDDGDSVSATSGLDG